VSSTPAGPSKQNRTQEASGCYYFV
jgi:hypothetical protein